MNKIELKVDKVLKAYKGDVEEVNKIEVIQKSFLERDYIKLRPYERMLFGTGLSVEDFKDKELSLQDVKEVGLKQGIILGSTSFITEGSDEISILAYNSTPFLTKIKFNQVLAILIVK